MSALTPDQMRALADAALDADLIPSDEHDALFARLAVNLRAAADQIEAVQTVLDRAEAENAPHLYPADFTDILTASQEDTA